MYRLDQLDLSTEQEEKDSVSQATIQTTKTKLLWKNISFKKAPLAKRERENSLPWAHSASGGEGGCDDITQAGDDITAAEGMTERKNQSSVGLDFPPQRHKNMIFPAFPARASLIGKRFSGFVASSQRRDAFTCGKLEVTWFKLTCEKCILTKQNLFIEGLFFTFHHWVDKTEPKNNS